MKVAFLFSGQIRPIDYELFKRSLNNLTNGLDYSIYVYCWEEMGKSLNHKNNISKPYKIKNISEYIKYIFEDFNLFDYGYENFKEFNHKLENKYKKILNSKKYHFGTINALPQIYTIYKSYKLLENSKKDFDLIFRCRFDSIFIHSFNKYFLEYMYKNNSLYNLNFGRAYYPKRVYDIFFGGSKISMNFISSIWNDLPNLVHNKFNNGLDQRDACRILYLAAKSKNIKVKSFNTRICDVYRNKGHSYEKYLMSSHVIRFNKNFISDLKLILDWLKYRKISNFKIILYFLKYILLIPISYLKRLKYSFKSF